MAPKAPIGRKREQEERGREEEPKAPGGRGKRRKGGRREEEGGRGRQEEVGGRGAQCGANGGGASMVLKHTNSQPIAPLRINCFLFGENSAEGRKKIAP